MVSWAKSDHVGWIVVMFFGPWDNMMIIQNWIAAFCAPKE